MTETKECPNCKKQSAISDIGFICKHCGYVEKGGSGRRPPPPN